MKKKDLTTAGIYLVIGVICFAALVLTDSKLDSLLIAVRRCSARGRCEDRQLCLLAQAGEPSGISGDAGERADRAAGRTYADAAGSKAYRHAYITNLRVTMAAALICGALKLIDILAFGDKLMYALAAWVILQLILVDVIYRCLNRKYSD